MGHKLVCLDCRIVKNLGWDYNYAGKPNCTKCGKPTMLINHRFRPPKKRDNAGWRLVKYLIDHGFTFQHIYQVGKNELSKTSGGNYAPYPQTLNDAKEFVEKFKDKKFK